MKVRHTGDHAEQSLAQSSLTVTQSPFPKRVSSSDALWRLQNDLWAPLLSKCQVSSATFLRCCLFPGVGPGDGRTSSAFKPSHLVGETGADVGTHIRMQ